jgi:hypothetical protein
MLSLLQETILRTPMSNVDQAREHFGTDTRVLTGYKRVALQSVNKDEMLRACVFSKYMRILMTQLCDYGQTGTPRNGRQLL